jgi:hypothetical protein
MVFRFIDLPAEIRQLVYTSLTPNTTVNYWGGGIITLRERGDLLRHDRELCLYWPFGDESNDILRVHPTVVRPDIFLGLP